MGVPQQAVVTGGAKGIGRAVVRRLADEGYRVLSLDRDGDANTAAATADSDAGRPVMAATADITVRSSVAEALEGLDRIDLLVNVAGIFWPRPFDDLTEQDFRSMLDVHVVGTFVMTQEAAKKMEAGARVVNIASRTYIGSANFAHYVAAKAAVVGLTRAFALDLAEREIAVNAVAPGLVNTDMVDALPDDLRAKLMALEPAGKFAEPDLIAETVAFVGRRGSYLNGQTLIVDGGKSLGGMFP